MVLHNGRIFHRWRKLIKEYNVSELTPTEFCRNKNISRNTFYAWRSRFKKDQSSVNNDSFLEVSLQESLPKGFSSTPGNSGIQIVFNDSFKISIEEDFNESVLLKVINVLGKVVC